MASIHFTQMLYTWPYIAFFSFPLLLPYILNAVLPQNAIPSPFRIGSTWHLIPRLGINLSFLVVMLVIVHYNTIIHPFTVADNRHYPFYVFRLLLRHPAIKYMVTPIYYICAWAAIVAMSGFPNDKAEKTTKLEGLDRDAAFSTPLSSIASLEPGTRASFVLIWLLATSLSLVTAPLVEPRYFILPWLMWRLHVPYRNPRGSVLSTSSSSVSSTSRDEHRRVGGGPEEKKALEEQKSPDWLGTVKEMDLAKYDYRLVLETLWFLGVNWGIGYVFLHWGFEWVQEKGSVQRFMW